jgi:hypothetical protein
VIEAIVITIMGIIISESNWEFERDKEGAVINIIERNTHDIILQTASQIDLEIKSICRKDAF